jgi:chromosome segregation ATPase
MAEQLPNGAGTVAPDTTKTEPKAQAVSIEQLEATRTELQAAKQALEDIKRAQAGSDAKVAKLLAEIEQKDAGKKTAEERIAEIERKAADAEARAQRQEWLNAGYKEAAARGLPARVVDNYGGPKDKLVEYLEAEKADREAIKNETLKSYMATNKHQPANGTPQAVIADYKNMSHDERLKHAISEAEKRTSGGS